MNRKWSKTFRLMSVAPFETAIGVLLIISGISQMAHWGNTDARLAVLPSWEAFVLNIITILAGIMMSAGIVAAMRRIEMSGLFIVIGVFLSRFILFGTYFGFLSSSFAQTGVFYLAVIMAAISRLTALRQGYSLILLLNSEEELDD